MAIRGCLCLVTVPDFCTFSHLPFDRTTSKTVVTQIAEMSKEEGKVEEHEVIEADDEPDEW